MNPRRNPRRNPLPRSRLSHAELITIRVNAVVGAMHGGAVLHLHFENGEQRWHLSGGGDVGSEIALAVLDCPEVENLDDALPLAGGAFPQTYVIRKEKPDDQRSH
jgi:hypothetical protein